MSRVLAVTLVALAAACGGGGDSADPDARIQRDAEVDCGALTVGRCAVAGGEPCSGVEAESPMFATVNDGDSMTMIVGFQGALMFPLAVRTSGIYPGEDGVPGDQPRVEAALYNAANEQISAYSNRALFTPVAGTDEYEWLYVFLLIPGAGDDLIGANLRAVAEASDKDGVKRCGELSFVGASN